MKFEIVGIEDVNYKSRRTGQQVIGTNLHCHVEGPDSKIKGCAVERLYCKEMIDCSVLNVGDKIEVFYNRYGSVDAVHLV